jgi:hypothetical protein
MDTSITYHKDEKVEELNEKISDILSEAFYSYIIRKGLLKRRTQTSIELVKKDLAKYE